MPKLSEVFVIREEATSVRLDVDDADLIVRAFDVLDKQASPDDKRRMSDIVDKIMAKAPHQKAPAAKDEPASKVTTPAGYRGPLKNSKER